MFNACSQIRKNECKLAASGIISKRGRTCPYLELSNNDFFYDQNAFQKIPILKYNAYLIYKYSTLPEWKNTAC
jgi:hypothetical protein